MTVLYVTGVLMTFVFNRNWSFAHNGVISSALIRYLLIYFLGFVVNWLALYLLADRAGMPHEWVQGAMILLLAIGLFLLQKFWVFNREAIP
jgi:putative flippase GtrA